MTRRIIARFSTKSLSVKCNLVCSTVHCVLKIRRDVNSECALYEIALLIVSTCKAVKHPTGLLILFILSDLLISLSLEHTVIEYLVGLNFIVNKKST